MNSQNNQVEIEKIKWKNLLLFSGSGKYLSIAVISLFFSSILGAFTPHVITSLSRSIGNVDLLYIGILKLIALAVLIYVNRAIYGVSVAYYVQALQFNIRTLCYRRWLAANLFNEKIKGKEFTQGEVLSRIINDGDTFRELITSGTFGLLIDLFFVFSSLISFLNMNMKTGLMIVLAEIGGSYLLVLGSKQMRGLFLEVRVKLGVLNQTLSNVSNGLKDLYFTRNDQYAFKSSVQSVDNFLIIQNKSNIWDAGLYSCAESMYPIILALVMLISPYSGITEAALIFAIIDLIQRSIGPIKEVSSKITNIQRAFTGVQRISEFFTYFPEREIYVPQTESIRFSSLKVSIPLFEYGKNSDKRDIFQLRDINFSGNKGELIGIVGLSGSGKSTLLKLLSNELWCDESKIELLAQNSQSESIQKNLHLEEYLTHVGLVTQESHLFTDTLVFNITMGKSTEGFEKFWADAIMSIDYLVDWGVLPDTKIVPKELSLGQKQLISGLRSLFLRKDVILLDEVSSGLDPALEKALRKMILLFQKNALTIIVAHRVETIVAADNILVMNNGRVVQSGKHDQLLISSSEYQAFINELKSH